MFLDLFVCIPKERGDRRSKLESSMTSKFSVSTPGADKGDFTRREPVHPALSRSPAQDLAIPSPWESELLGLLFLLWTFVGILNFL